MRNVKRGFDRKLIRDELAVQLLQRKFRHEHQKQHLNNHSNTVSTSELRNSLRVAREAPGSPIGQSKRSMKTIKALEGVFSSSFVFDDDID